MNTHDCLQLRIFLKLPFVNETVNRTVMLYGVFFRSVLRDNINKLHKQLLDERNKTEKLKQDFVCFTF